MPEPGIENLQARMAIVERDIAALQASHTAAAEFFRQWRHDEYGIRVTQITADWFNLRRDFDLFAAEVKAANQTGRRRWDSFWSIAKPVITWALIAFFGWLSWMLLHLYGAIPKK